MANALDAMKKKLAASDALLLNIAYPLGMSAYRMFKEVSENVFQMRCVYIMGREAALNSSSGVVRIPHAV